MSFKIVVDSCCELPEEYLQDSRFEIVPLGLEVGDYQIQDDENFDQAEFLKKVAECPKCPKSACPSPERFREAYHTEAEHVYVITLSSHLSGSYNSAVLGMNLYREKYGKKQIHVIDSESASCGETQIVKKLVELEEQGLSATVLDMYCVKPLDAEGVIKAAKNAKAVITVEEHAPFGGLGSMVAQVVGAECPRKVLNMALPDAPVITGTSQEVFDYYGLNAEGIAKKAVEALK